MFALLRLNNKEIDKHWGYTCIKVIDSESLAVAETEAQAHINAHISDAINGCIVIAELKKCLTIDIGEIIISTESLSKAVIPVPVILMEKEDSLIATACRKHL